MYVRYICSNAENIYNILHIGITHYLFLITYKCLLPVKLLLQSSEQQRVSSINQLTSKSTGNNLKIKARTVSSSSPSPLSFFITMILSLSVCGKFQVPVRLCTFQKTRAIKESLSLSSHSVAAL